MNLQRDVTDVKRNVSELRPAIARNSDATEELLHLVGEKVDKLIDVIAGKGMVPLPVFKWLVVSMIVFIFAIIFGVGAAQQLFPHLGLGR